MFLIYFFGLIFFGWILLVCFFYVFGVVFFFWIDLWKGVEEIVVFDFSVGFGLEVLKEFFGFYII